MLYDIAHTLITIAACVGVGVGLFIGIWQLVDSYTVAHFRKLYSYGSRYKRWTDALLTAIVSACFVFLSFTVAVAVTMGILTILGY